MVDDFWSKHVSYAEAARKLATTRQNIYQRCSRGSIPCDFDIDGRPGVPIEWVNQTLDLRARDQKEEQSV